MTDSRKSATVTEAAPDWREAIEAVVRGTLRRDEPLGRHTTLGVGGPADLWLEPEDAADLSAALSVVRRSRTPYCVLGGGSNVLVGDKGIRGLVVRLLPDFAPLESEERGEIVRVVFPAGMATTAVRRYARERGLVGPEFLIGIPGTLGGAIQMNAGTRIGEMVDVVDGAEVAHPDGTRWIDAEAFEFAYRHAVVPPGGIVTRIALLFRHADAAAVRAAQARAKEELEKRHATQPKGKSAGSMFKNPPGDYAGRLIDAAGLKGKRIGGAHVSEVHANFLMNDGTATARDLLDLVELCRREVSDLFGVRLELEVKLMGEF
jgi:UDP-N-acetylmuramate dehydrogenase